MQRRGKLLPWTHIAWQVDMIIFGLSMQWDKILCDLIIHGSNMTTCVWFILTLAFNSPFLFCLFVRQRLFMYTENILGINVCIKLLCMCGCHIPVQFYLVTDDRTMGLLTWWRLWRGNNYWPSATLTEPSVFVSYEAPNSTSYLEHVLLRRFSC